MHFSSFYNSELFFLCLFLKRLKSGNIICGFKKEQIFKIYQRSLNGTSELHNRKQCFDPFFVCVCINLSFKFLFLFVFLQFKLIFFQLFDVFFYILCVFFLIKELITFLWTNCGIVFLCVCVILALINMKNKTRKKSH